MSIIITLPDSLEELIVLVANAVRDARATMSGKERELAIDQLESLLDSLKAASEITDDLRHACCLALATQ